MIEENLSILADASLRDDDTPAPMVETEDPGLCSMRSLDLFMNWYTMGGMNRGVTLTELSEMPAWLLRDFKYLLGKFNAIKRDKENYKKMVEHGKVQNRGNPLQGHIPGR